MRISCGNLENRSKIVFWSSYEYLVSWYQIFIIYFRDEGSEKLKAALEADRQANRDSIVIMMYRNLPEAKKAKMCHLFNIVYALALHGKPMSDMDMQCELAIKMGVDLGLKYQNRLKAKEFLRAIADCMRQDHAAVVKQAPFISILSDGSTDRAIMEQETVMIRVVDKGTPITVMADIVSV